QSTRPAPWATPVALAATILLCLSIVLNITLNTNHPAADRTGPRTDVLRETVAPLRTAPQPAAPAPAAPAPAASAAAASASTASAPGALAAAPGSTLSKRAADAAESEPSVPERKAEAAAAPHPQDPKAWLRQIELLRTEGKNAQADAEM